VTAGRQKTMWPDTTPMRHSLLIGSRQVCPIRHTSLTVMLRVRKTQFISLR
jgi:hypothetical protein